LRESFLDGTLVKKRNSPDDLSIRDGYLFEKVIHRFRKLRRCGKHGKRFRELAVDEHRVVTAPKAKKNPLGGFGFAEWVDILHPEREEL
jgi:hypothetical protein